DYYCMIWHNNAWVF
nr:immunoglobulin light chain junction region [Macaca mulatta]MOV72868.1 immunoglobulin light chain junction region [Macaca mulatta]MOW07506.1 immunoglobulin light chain junction region [Macaca mulatta]MOW71162.1 immunoglobulin light chain junction region [Macaca mulatta]MOW72535.1 immunoglobulin light chain junction region [Macaca mulatta]